MSSVRKKRFLAEEREEPKAKTPKKTDGNETLCAVLSAERAEPVEVLRAEEWAARLRSQSAASSSAWRPEVEARRAVLFDVLRREHSKIVRAVVGIAPPKNSLERFVLERQACGNASEPLFPESDRIGASVSPSLLREILEDVPVKVPMFASTAHDARRSLETFCQAARTLAVHGFGPVPPLAIALSDEISRRCDEASTRAAENAAVQEILVELRSLKDAVCPALQAAMRPLAEAACRAVAVTSTRLASEVRALRSSLEHSATPVPGVEVANVARSHEGPPLLELRAAAASAVITKQAFESLGQRWDRSANSGRLKDEFLPAQASGLHAAISQATSFALARLFGVGFELFASPLNASTQLYCSAHPDVDPLFGSCGDFFQFTPWRGSFEANPPFVEELLVAMVRRIELSLCRSPEPLSFAVIVPKWDDAEGVKLLKSSQFHRGTVILKAREHTFIDGSQHMCRNTFKAIHDSYIVFLQNNPGAAQWPVTDDLLSKLLEASKIAGCTK